MSTARATTRNATRAPAGEQQATGDNASRLSRQAWIDAAVAKLAEDSVTALRVDELAEQLGVTKGSFYWHFETREALLQAVLAWWQQLMTRHIQEIVDKLPADPRQRLETVFRIGLSPHPSVPGGPFELTLRDWARRDPAVRKVVLEVDGAREELATKLYLELGLSLSEARDYAHAHMAYVIGDRMSKSGDDAQDLRRRRRIAFNLLIPQMISTKKR